MVTNGRFSAQARDNLGALWKVTLRARGSAQLTRDGELAAELGWSRVYAAIAEGEPARATARWIVEALARRAHGMLPDALVAELEEQAAQWLRMSADELVPRFVRGRALPSSESLLVAVPIAGATRRAA